MVLLVVLGIDAFGVLLVYFRLIRRPWPWTSVHSTLSCRDGGKKTSGESFRTTDLPHLVSLRRLPHVSWFLPLVNTHWRRFVLHVSRTYMDVIIASVVGQSAVSCPLPLVLSWSERTCFLVMQSRRLRLSMPLQLRCWGR